MAKGKRGLALQLLAARAVSYCPRSLAEALCRELGIPMSAAYFDSTTDNFAAWLPDAPKTRRKRSPT